MIAGACENTSITAAAVDSAVFMPPRLQQRDLHLWCAEVPFNDVLWPGLLERLSAGERRQAARYRFDRHRHAFIAARYFLRWMLSRYLACRPADVTFVYGQNGKPALAPGMPGRKIHFNQSHSSGVVFCAAVLDEEVGVDVEEIRSIPDDLQIARQFFCQREFEYLQQLAPAERTPGFCRCWTRKEAYLKATGDGLYGGLNEFEVSIAPDDRPRFIHIRGDETAAREWTLIDVKLDDRFAAAVAIRGEGWRPRAWKLRPFPHDLNLP